MRSSFHAHKHLSSPPPPTLSVREISTSALERLVLPSETKSVRGGLSGGGYGGVFDFKKEQSRHTDSRSADILVDFEKS